MFGVLFFVYCCWIWGGSCLVFCLLLLLWIAIVCLCVKGKYNQGVSGVALYLVKYNWLCNCPCAYIVVVLNVYFPNRGGGEKNKRGWRRYEPFKSPRSQLEREGLPQVGEDVSAVIAHLKSSSVIRDSSQPFLGFRRQVSHCPPLFPEPLNNCFTNMFSAHHCLPSRPSTGKGVVTSKRAH